MLIKRNRRRHHPSFTPLAHLIRHAGTLLQSNYIAVHIDNVTHDGFVSSWQCAAAAGHDDGSSCLSCGATYLFQWRLAEVLCRDLPESSRNDTSDSPEPPAVPWEKTVVRCDGSPLLVVQTIGLKPDTTYHLQVRFLTDAAAASDVGHTSPLTAVRTSAAMPLTHPKLEVVCLTDTSVTLRLDKTSLWCVPSQQSRRPLTPRSEPHRFPHSQCAAILKRGAGHAVAHPLPIEDCQVSPCKPAAPTNVAVDLVEGNFWNGESWLHGVYHPPLALCDRLQIAIAVEWSELLALSTVALPPRHAAISADRIFGYRHQEDTVVDRAHHRGDETAWFCIWTFPLSPAGHQSLKRSLSPTAAGNNEGDLYSVVMPVDENRRYVASVRRISSEGLCGEWAQPMEFISGSSPPFQPLALVEPVDHQTLRVEVASCDGFVFAEGTTCTVRCLRVADNPSVLRIDTLFIDLALIYVTANSSKTAHEILSIAQRYTGYEGELIRELSLRYPNAADTQRLSSAIGFWTSWCASGCDRTFIVDRWKALMMEVATLEQRDDFFSCSSQVIGEVTRRPIRTWQDTVTLTELPCSAHLCVLVSLYNRCGIERAASPVFCELPAPKPEGIVVDAVGPRSCILRLLNINHADPAVEYCAMRETASGWVACSEIQSGGMCAVGPLEPCTAYRIALCCRPVGVDRELVVDAASLMVSITTKPAPPSAVTKVALCETSHSASEELRLLLYFQHHGWPPTRCRGSLRFVRCYWSLPSKIPLPEDADTRPATRPEADKFTFDTELATTTTDTVSGTTIVTVSSLEKIARWLLHGSASRPSVLDAVGERRRAAAMTLTPREIWLRARYAPSEPRQHITTPVPDMQELQGLCCEVDATLRLVAGDYGESSVVTHRVVLQLP